MKTIKILSLSMLTFFLSSFTQQELSLYDKLTFITTSSPIPSNPSTEMLERCLDTFLVIPEFRGCKMIIACDGVPPQQAYRTLAYEMFLKNLQKLCDTDPRFANTKLVIHREHKHLANSLRGAIDITDTPFVFVHQHDFALARPFDLVNTIASMEMNPGLKMVRLNKFNNTENWWDGPVDDVIEGGSLVPLTRTFGWSDNDHLARLDYYTDFVMPKVTWNGAMEWFLHSPEKIMSNHKAYGTYLYGPPGDKHYLHHLDGRTYQ